MAHSIAAKLIKKTDGAETFAAKQAIKERNLIYLHFRHNRKIKKKATNRTQYRSSTSHQRSYIGVIISTALEDGACNICAISI
jgi:hypothetical protein